MDGVPDDAQAVRGEIAAGPLRAAAAIHDHADESRNEVGAVGRRILAIDGGGIRCLIGIEVLCALEERLAGLCGDPGRRLWQDFDLVAGTSGGAIVASAIALGLPMHEVRDFVVRNARNMFREARWYARFQSLYDKTELEQNIKDWFGEATTLGSRDLRTLLLIVMRNWSTDSAWLVSNNLHAPFNARHLDDCNLQLRLWELARASSAAPAYYVPETIRFGRDNAYDFVFVDGGLTGFLNPAFKAFLYATSPPYGLRWPTGEQRLTLVSIGSGEVRHRRIGVPAESVNLWHAIRGVPQAMLQATIREQDLLCRTFGRCRTGGPIDLELGDLRHDDGTDAPALFGYHRINPVLTAEGLASLGCGHIRPRDVARIDAVDHVEAFCEIGRALAQRVIDGVVADCGASATRRSAR